MISCWRRLPGSFIVLTSISQYIPLSPDYDIQPKSGISTDYSVVMVRIYLYKNRIVRGLSVYSAKNILTYFLVLIYLMMDLAKTPFFEVRL